MQICFRSVWIRQRTQDNEALTVQQIADVRIRDFSHFSRYFRKQADALPAMAQEKAGEPH